MSGPYDSEGNVNHPGVKGEPYRTTNLTPMGKVDNPGTGTFPPHMQGVINKAEPQGMSQTTQERDMLMAQKLQEGVMREQETDKQSEDGFQEAAPNQPTVPGLNQAVNIPEVAPLNESEDEDGTNE